MESILHLSDKGLLKEGRSPNTLQVFFFQDCFDSSGKRFNSSPGILPMIGNALKYGFNIRFFCNKYTLLRAIRKTPVDVVSISAMERTLISAIQTAQRIRKNRKKLILILGGITLSSYAYDLVSDLFDIVVIEESEIIFPAILFSIANHLEKFPGEQFENNKFKYQSHAHKIGIGGLSGSLETPGVEKVKNSYFIRNEVKIGLSGVFIRDSSTGEIWKLDAPQLIAHEINSQSKPTTDEISKTFIMPWNIVRKHRWPILEIFSQKGCKWGKCNFCLTDTSTRRALPVDILIKTICAAQENGIRMVSFSDDMFIQDRKWTKYLLQILSELKIRIHFRAQTRACQSIWPFLDSMSKIGFTELSFGIESLNSERIQFLGKSTNGKRYIVDAKETILRTAKAGIIPTLYMILTDPESSLQIVLYDLLSILNLIKDVYLQTSILPKVSWSLCLLPVSGSKFINQFPHSTKKLHLSNREILIPLEYYLNEEITNFLQKAEKLTFQIIHRRENLESLRIYLELLKSLFLAKEDIHSVDLCDVGLREFKELNNLMELDIKSTANRLISLFRDQSNTNPYFIDELLFNPQRFGGNYNIIGIYKSVLTETLGKHLL